MWATASFVTLCSVLACVVLLVLLSKIPYEDMTPAPIELPPRKTVGDYHRPPMNEQFFVPNAYP